MTINRTLWGALFVLVLFPIRGVFGGPVVTSNTPDHIQLAGPGGSGNQIVPAGSSSSDLRVYVRDIYDDPTPVASGTQIYLTATDSGGNPFIPEISFDSVNFSPIAGPLVVPTSQRETPPFQFRRSVLGHVTLRAEAVDFPSAGESRFAWFDFEILPSGSGFTNVRVRTTSQPSATVGTASTLTPDRDGLDEGVVMACTPPTLASPWELVISSDPAFMGGIFRHYYGYGTNDTFWFGEGMEGRTVPNGTYYARYQMVGQGLVSSNLLLTVQSAGVQGMVEDGTVQPQPDVEVNVFGPAGGGYDRTKSDGRFFVNGLKGNSSYQVELRKSGFITKSFSVVTGPSTGTAVDVGTKTLSSGVTLEVQATVSSPSTRDVYGNVNVYNASYSENQWGPLHVASGATVSDNGRNSQDPQFGPHTLITVSSNTSYTVEVNLPDYGRFTQTVVSPGSGSLPVSFALSRKANVYGLIQLPSAMNSPYSGEWASVDAILPGAKMPSASGGVFLQNGNTSGVYQLFGVPPGDYTLRAYVRGYVTSIRTVTVANVDLGDIFTGGIDFLPLSTGGKIMGAVTVLGDSSLLSTASFGGPSCGAGKFPVNLNASSRSTYGNVFAQVCLSTSSTSVSGDYQISGLANGPYELFSYLPGFELVPAGSQSVTVSGGVATKNITFQALTGQVKIQATLPSGDTGSLVTYQLIKDNPNSVTRGGVLSGSPVAEATESQLGTGLYRVVVQNKNPGRGLVQETVLAVTNGSLTTAPVDLTIPAYSVSGTLGIVGNIVLPSTWSVTVSSVPGLVAAGITPTVDVYPLPLPNYYQDNFRPIRSISATVFTSSAVYQVPALAPGGYLLRVREDLNPPTPACNGCQAPPGLPELASDSHLFFVGTAAVAGANLTLTNGAKVTGTISRPSADTSTDLLSFTLRLRRSDNLTVWAATVTSNGASAPFAFSHVAPGDYVLETTENGTTARYSSQPAAIKVGTGDATANVTLVTGGTIVGRVRDADTQTLITAENVSQFLPENFEIAAQANPWVPGGYLQADRSNTGSGFNFDAVTGQFRIARVIPDTHYDLRLRGYSSLGADAIARGVRTYAPTVVAGIQVAAGQTVDVGVIDLKQGAVLSGTVRNAGGSPLPNIRVTARPAANNGGDRWDLQVETYSKEDGKYELQGIDRNQRFYDILAAPRIQAGETFARLSGPRYAEERRRMVDVNATAKLAGNDFTLSLANGSITGKVVTADGGTLIPAFSDKTSQTGQRGADIVLHRIGATFDDNPLGEIEERTDADGTFRVDGLKPGAYTLRALALGYASALKPIVVPAGTAAVGTLSLNRGATVSGTIAKPDGSSPSVNEVRMVLGVDENFEEFVFGTIDSSLDTQLVTGYSVSGFRTDKTYSLVIVTGKDEIVEVETGVTLTDANEQRVIALQFRPAPPHVFVNQTMSVSGPDRVTSLRFFMSQPLRNLTAADNDLAALLVLSTGVGTLSEWELSSSRDSLTALYTAPVSETSFGVRLSFYTNGKNPDSPTGENFFFDKPFAFYSGISARRSSTISNVTGGDCALEGVPTGVTFPAGSFNVGTSSSVEVGLQSADALGGLPTGSPRLARAAAAVSAARTLGAAAYPTAGLYRALTAAPAVNAFSAFYDIFLPAGLNHLLKKEARLTLEYDASVTDPSGLNVYFYDPIHDVYLLENAQKTVDEVNRTITVSVGHLSTFVVLPSQASIIGTNTYTGQDIRIYNVPNPFNLRSKTVTLEKAEIADRIQTIEGTLVRYSLPSGKSGNVKIEIYDVAGDLVRVLTQSAPTDGTYYYLEWDGRTDGGDPVASGVYLARFTLNEGDEKMFRMAVIK